MSSKQQHYVTGLERLAGRDSALSAKKDATRRRIISSAVALLSERGIRRMSMEEIAERAGISRGTLYLYAKSKEDIVIKALAEEQLQVIEREQAEDGPEHSPRERLKRSIVDSIVCFEKMPLLALMVKGDVELLRSLEHHPDVQAAFPGPDDHQRLMTTLTAAFNLLPPARVETITNALRALSSAGPQLIDNAATHGLGPRELAEVLADLIVDGIGEFDRG